MGLNKKYVKIIISFILLIIIAAGVISFTYKWSFSQLFSEVKFTQLHYDGKNKFGQETAKSTNIDNDLLFDTLGDMKFVKTITIKREGRNACLLTGITNEEKMFIHINEHGYFATSDGDYYKQVSGNLLYDVLMKEFTEEKE